MRQRTRFSQVFVSPIKAHRLTLIANLFLLLSKSLAQDLPAESQTISATSPTYFAAEPYQLSVVLETNGTLAVSPNWLGVANSSLFGQMTQPPSVRTTRQAGWLVGEFALADGTWSPLFTAPISSDNTSSKNGLTNDAPSIDTTKNGLTVNSFPAPDSSTTPLNTLAAGASDPDFPVAVSMAYLQTVVSRPLAPGTRRFFVNNTSGNDLAEGRMIHPQTGKLATQGPLKTLAAVLKQIQSGDEIVLIGTGQSYTGNFTIPVA